MILRIFDVSNYIYSGKKDTCCGVGFKESANILTPREFPCGGLTYLFEEIERFKNPYTDIIFCLDEAPHIKRQIMDTVFPQHGGYKGNRSAKTPELSFQREIVSEILEAIGFNVLHKIGYEADDFIASVVGAYKDDYEKVYIHTRDSDLYYLVDSKVECVKAGNIGKHVTLENWEKTVITGMMCPYNCLTLNKMRKGERGDNIPAAPYEVIHDIMVKVPIDKLEFCGDNKWLEDFIRSNTDDKATLAIMQLIMPLILSPEDIELHCEEIDIGLYDYMCHMLLGKHTVYPQAAVIKGTALLEELADRWESI